MLGAIIALEFTTGILYALFLQHTRLGRHIAERVTWFSVVIGVGFTLLLAIPVIGWEQTGTLFLLFAASSVGVVIRSLINDQQQLDELWQRLRGHDDDKTT